LAGRWLLAGLFRGGIFNTLEEAHDFLLSVVRQQMRLTGAMLTNAERKYGNIKEMKELTE
jgi:hypothetical protein